MVSIPFNRPCLTGGEVEYILEAVKKGHLSGGGTFAAACQRLLKESLGAREVFLTPSCTSALEMAAVLLDVGPGDEVIVPSFTFVSTANAFALRGAKPSFADITPSTLNIDAEQIERQITHKTRAIVPVHYAGVGCDMEAIAIISQRYNLPIVEDNAHGLYGKYNGKYLGTFGAMGTLSFHETKNFTCGEGGALIVNDPKYTERAEIVREKGTNRTRFARGEVDKYTWVDLGSSYLPSEIQAAFLFAQLERRRQILNRRQQLFERYRLTLRDWAKENNVGLPNIPNNCQQAYHMFYLLMPSLLERTRFIKHLKEKGIMAVFHYVPLHLSPMGQKWGYKPGDFPVTESVSSRLVRLPFFFDLTDDEHARVCDAVETFSVSK